MAIIHKMETQKTWDSICIVGLGNHAKTKLIPTSKKIYKKDNVSIVTKKNDLEIKNFKRFESIEDSFSNNKKSCLYYLATPPIAHYHQSKKILENGFDVMIEKPSFINIKHLNEIIQLCDQKDLLMIEAMMFLENSTANLVKETLKSNLNNIKEIKTTFTIPKVPLGTFRYGESLSSSVLSDIGCYPITLLAYSEFDLSNLKITNLEKSNEKYIFHLFLEDKNFKFYSKVGLDYEYQNNIKITYRNNDELEVSPFYYGRPSTHYVKRIIKGSISQQSHLEENAYFKLLNKKRYFWKNQQTDSLKRIINVVKALQNLASQINMSLN